jgi:MFS family permease
MVETIKKDKMVSKDYILVMIANSGTAFMNFFFAAVLLVYVQAIGGTEIQFGLLTLVYSLTALFVRPASGILSDKFGRMWQMIIGAAICVICCVMFGLPGFVPYLLVIRALQGIGFGMHSTCAGAVAADVLPKSRMAEGIGIFGLGGTIAQAAAPAIGLAIIAPETMESYRLLFFISGALCLMSFIANCCITYERKRKKLALANQNADVEETLLKSTISDEPESASAENVPLPKTFLGFEYALFPPIAVLILIQLGLVGVLLFLPHFAREVGVENPGWYFTASAIGMFISRLTFGKVVDRHGSDIVIIPGFIAMTVFIALIPFANSLLTFIAIGFPFGFVQGAVIPTFNSMVFQRTSPQRRGRASGAFFTAIDIAFATGGPVLGALSYWHGLRYIYWFGAILFVLALILYILIASDKRHNARLAKQA